MQATIAKTGFLTSVTSYVGFWLLEAVRPGFVARYVSVHLFLLSAVLFGFWWSSVDHVDRDRPRGQIIVAIGFGILLSVLLWSFGEGFGSLRVLVAIGGVGIPLLVLRLLRYK